MTQDTKKAAYLFLKVILGLSCLGLAAYLLIVRFWWQPAWMVVKGSAPVILVLIGAAILAAAKE